jgi:hypothetical protein
MKTSIPKLHSIRFKNRENVVALPIATRENIDPQIVLMAAINARMTEVVIVGYGSEGDEYFAANIADGADALWLLERARKKLLEMGGE